MSKSEKTKSSVEPASADQDLPALDTKKQSASDKAVGGSKKTKAGTEKSKDVKESVGLTAAIQGLQFAKSEKESATGGKTKASEKLKASVKRSVNPTSSLGLVDSEGDVDTKANVRRTTRSVQRDKVDDLLTVPENFKNAMDERFPEGEPLLFVDLKEPFRRSRGERAAKAGITHIPHIPSINIVDALNGGAKFDFSSQED